MLEQNFDRVWFFPPDSMAYRYTVTNSEVTKIQSLDTFVPEKRTNKLMVLIPGNKFETRLRDFRLCLHCTCSKLLVGNNCILPRIKETCLFLAYYFLPDINKFSIIVPKSHCFSKPVGNSYEKTKGLETYSIQFLLLFRLWTIIIIKSWTGSTNGRCAVEPVVKMIRVSCFKLGYYLLLLSVWHEGTHSLTSGHSKPHIETLQM